MELWALRQMQGLPLELKIRKSELRIREWYEHWGGDVYVAFSGGKDSTVLLDLVRRLYPHVPAVFADTGLEYPEIRGFVKTIDNVDWVRPSMSFPDVLQKHGYPVVSKLTAYAVEALQNPTPQNYYTRRLRLEGIRKDGTKTTGQSVLAKKWRKLIDAPFKVSDRCCDIFKKKPLAQYRKETKRQAYIGNMASDGSARERAYLMSGCNFFEGKRRRSTPLGFWLEEDIWEYMRQRELPYSPIYDMGYADEAIQCWRRCADAGGVTEEREP